MFYLFPVETYRLSLYEPLFKEALGWFDDAFIARDDINPSKHSGYHMYHLV
jgi:hypothetical protein